MKNRRSFLKMLGVTAATLPVAARVYKPGVAYSMDVPQVAVDPESAKSKQFGYHVNAEEVDATKFPKRAGEEGAKQFCSNCQLLVKGGIELDGQEGKYGACSLFPEGVVAEAGWCNMWVQKIG